MQVLELPQPGSANAENNAYVQAHGGHPYFIGAQFHPERSATAGSTLLRRFLETPLP